MFVLLSSGEYSDYGWSAVIELDRIADKDAIQDIAQQCRRELNDHLRIRQRVVRAWQEENPLPNPTYRYEKTKAAQERGNGMLVGYPTPEYAAWLKKQTLHDAEWDAANPAPERVADRLIRLFGGRVLDIVEINEGY